MEITTKQLRSQAGKLLLLVSGGQEITVTHKGKLHAKIIPVDSGKNIDSIAPDASKEDNELFGMWKDRKDMEDLEQYIRNMRKGRKLC
jgi:antitoxin (DNA-binding transcriptional repressor) of toxin-antitoxin stability system